MTNMIWEEMLKGYEGSFYQALAEAYIKADKTNRVKLEKGFPELKQVYAKWYHGGDGNVL